MEEEERLKGDTQRKSDIGGGGLANWDETKETYRKRRRPLRRRRLYTKQEEE